MSHDHARFAALVTDAISHDRELAAHDIAAARECEQCAMWLDAVAVALEPRAVPTVDAAVAARVESRAGSIARRMAHLWNALSITIGVALGALVFYYLRWEPLLDGELAGPTEIAKLLIATGVTGWFLYLGATRKLYARWDGRQLQGICVGIARYYGVPVWLVRTILIVMTLFGFGGISIYIALAFAIGFRPDDRKHLMVFSIPRWFRARRAR